MATKFFSDGAVHAYFNPYETPYDAFMNYMNVLSDFEIRLRKWFPDTAEQDQIYKLGAQVIEKDMVIMKQAEEIVKLTKKVAKSKPVAKPAAKKISKPAVKSLIEKPPLKEVNKPAIKTTTESAKKPVKKRAEKTIKPISIKKTTPVKPALKAKKGKKSE
jgi:alpha-amylase